ncbi:hypothetical protein RAM07_02140 [Lactobacillus helsingborgensis]|nr:hypothetical protein [Lactobacillus helsingborgensis]WLT00794.1 hypothetical protein RAM07_02140 [Lactobacillus helsingborgensis]
MTELIRLQKLAVNMADSTNEAPEDSDSCHYSNCTTIECVE